MGLRYKKANGECILLTRAPFVEGYWCYGHRVADQVLVTHPELGVTVQLPIISVKKNPQNPLYTQLGVLSKGTVLEVNVSELGLTTTSGKVVWGRYAQVTNNPENDGCVNAVLLV